MNIEKKLEIAKSLLICAFEGGSNYWYRIENGGNSYKRAFTDEGIIISNYFLQDEDKERVNTLNKSALLKGIELLENKYLTSHYADAISENDDAITGDVFLQLCLFDEVIYG